MNSVYHTRNIISLCLKKGKKVFGPCGVLYTLPCFVIMSKKQKEKSLHILVGKKVARSAVERNFLKRRARHIFKKNHTKKSGHIHVFVFSPKGARMSFCELEKCINCLLNEVDK